jgi:Tol biopolymer transport system component
MRMAPVFVALSILMVLSGAAGAQVSLVRIPELVGSADTHAVSGNGAKVVFSSPNNPVDANGDGNLEIFIYDVASRQTMQVTRTASQPGLMDNTNVRVDHNGSRIAFRSMFALDAGSARLNERDIFIADLDYSSNPPGIQFRRVTATGERGDMALSGNGAVIILVSDHNLAGNNAEGNVELFRINLDPAPSITQLTDTPGGIAESIWDVSVDVSYDGQEVVFTSNRDLTGYDFNPEGNPEIFRLANDIVEQITRNTPAGVVSRSPRIGGDLPGYIAFVSNADLIGENPDGNYEVFLEQENFGLKQITHSIGGDEDPFGAANDQVDISDDGSFIIFSSNRDHVPADGTAPGNADGNRELFLARVNLREYDSPIDITQLTDTVSSGSAGALGNQYPRISADATVIAFNSHVDLGVPGSSSLYAAILEGAPSSAPPSLIGFLPVSGSPGVRVKIVGYNLGGATRVQFGALDAAGFDVVSNRRVYATVPNGLAPGPITIITPNGSVTSANDFLPAAFKSFGEEFNQGLADYPPVSGKDALVRVFGGVESPAQPAAVKITRAELKIRAPSGSEFTIAPFMYRDELINTDKSVSERDNVNFFIPGNLLYESGSYDFNAKVWPAGEPAYSPSFKRTFTRTKDVVLIFQTLFRAPNTQEWKNILHAFEVFSRIFPVRAAVGDLEGAIGASDFEAGVRVAYLAAPLFEDEAGSSHIECAAGGCAAYIAELLQDRLAAVNSGGFEETEFAVAFSPQEGNINDDGIVAPDCQSWAQLDFRSGRPGSLTGWTRGSSIWVSLCISVGGVLSHEMGHAMGLVPWGAPNNNGPNGHSSNLVIPTPGFNLTTRESIPRPSPVMIRIAPEEILLLESYDNGQPLDYPYLVLNRRLPDQNAYLFPESTWAYASSPQPPKPGNPQKAASQSDQPRFVFMGTLEPGKNRVSLRHAYVTNKGGYATPLDTAADMVLAFLDDSGSVISLNPIAVASTAYDLPRKLDAPEPPAALTAIRPLPPQTKIVEIRRKNDQQVLLRLKPGAAPPKVVRCGAGLSKTENGTMLILNWNAEDPDGDPLSYHLAYSRDGGKHYQPLVAATRKTKFSLPAENLAGGKAVVFQMTASDGLNSAAAVSNSIGLPEHEPVAAITSLKDGDNFTVYDLIALRGLAYDMEDGIIGDQKAERSRLQWVADGSHKLGSGPTATLQPGLKPGRHKITLTATDESGRSGSDTKIIYIEKDTDKDGLSDTLERKVPRLDALNPFDAPAMNHIKAFRWGRRVPETGHEP